MHVSKILAVAGLSLGIAAGCSGRTPSDQAPNPEKVADRTEWTLPLEPVKPDTPGASRKLQALPALPKPVSDTEALSAATKELNDYFGNSGQHSRTIREAATQMSVRSDVLQNLPKVAGSRELVFVEQVGKFKTSKRNRAQKLTVEVEYPFACVVLDPETGLVLLRARYDARHRPR